MNRAMGGCMLRANHLSTSLNTGSRIHESYCLNQGHMHMSCELRKLPMGPPFMFSLYKCVWALAFN